MNVEMDTDMGTDMDMGKDINSDMDIDNGNFYCCIITCVATS